MKKTIKKASLKRRVRYFAKKIGIDIKTLSIRPMNNKWASCSLKGNLNFNLELLDMNEDIKNYVIVHELLHFKVPNHGKLWRSLMVAYLSNHSNLEKKLNNFMVSCRYT